ncbi:MAG: hypothetical protein GWO24_16080, partial [Akkermansiaceae bacterium]|nr:hypothetical protein [Akkermansiaceae bacterium]
MWGIASEFVEGSEYSINQAMLAIQRRNPEAFIGNNINSLKRGAILRLPTFEQVTAMTRREAMLEAIRQEEEYRARREGRPFDRPAPMVVDVPAESTVAAGGTVETATAEPESP